MNVVMKRIQNIETSKSSVLIKICDAGIINEVIKTRDAKSAGSNGILAHSLLKLNDPKVGGAEF